MAQTVSINLPAVMPAAVQATDLKSHPAFKDGAKDTQNAKDKQKTPQVPVFSGVNAAYVIDNDRNVVLRLTDLQGKVVMQIPSEEYLIMVRLMKENAEKILLSKA